MTMLIKYDTFSEDVTRFYIAECVLAIEAVHKLGFIHRCVLIDDLRPPRFSPDCAETSNPIIFSSTKTDTSNYPTSVCPQASINSTIQHTTPGC